MFTELPILAKLVIGAAIFVAGYFALTKLDDIDWNRCWPVIAVMFIAFTLLAKFAFH